MDRLTNRKHGQARSVRFDEESVLAMWSKLAKYEDAEEQGLLIKLPCKVGDTVYELMHDEIAAPADYIGEYEVQDVSARQIKYADDWVDIGYKNLYLTREAAEEALKVIVGR